MRRFIPAPFGGLHHTRSPPSRCAASTSIPAPSDLPTPDQAPPVSLTCPRQDCAVPTSTLGSAQGAGPGRGVGTGVLGRFPDPPNDARLARRQRRNALMQHILLPCHRLRCVCRFAHEIARPCMLAPTCHMRSPARFRTAPPIVPPSPRFETATPSQPRAIPCAFSQSPSAHPRPLAPTSRGPCSHQRLIGQARDPAGDARTSDWRRVP